MEKLRAVAVVAENRISQRRQLYLFIGRSIFPYLVSPIYVSVYYPHGMFA